MYGIGKKRGAGAGIGLLFDSYEEGTTQIFESLICEGSVVLDIGAHIGYFTLVAAQAVGQTGRVFAFEPEPGNYYWLEKNIHSNGHNNATAIPAAVGDWSGRRTLYLGPTTGTHSVFASDEGSRESGIDVDMTTVDEFLAAHEWPFVDLIKMDIEGAEPLAVKGMSQLFKRQNELKILLEFNPARLVDEGTSPTQFLAELQSNDFTIEEIDEVNGHLHKITRDTSAAFADRIGRKNVNILCTRQIDRS